MTIEDYVCASEGYMHYNTEIWENTYAYQVDSGSLTPGLKEGLKKYMILQDTDGDIQTILADDIHDARTV